MKVGESILVRLKQERIRLGNLLDTCNNCSLVPRIGKGTWDVSYCTANCSHWLKMQEQRILVETLQKEARLKKQVIGM